MSIHEMATLGASGDTKLLWDSDAAPEVENARRTYEDLTRRGYAAFAVRRTGEKGERVREFDPTAEKLIMVPQIAGG